MWRGMVTEKVDRSKFSRWREISTKKRDEVKVTSVTGKDDGGVINKGK